MIEIRAIEDAESGEKVHRLFIDGVSLDKALVYCRSGKANADLRPIGIESFDQETSQLLCTQRICDFPGDFMMLEFLAPMGSLEIIGFLTVFIKQDSAERGTIGFILNRTPWEYEFTFRDYHTRMDQLAH